MRINRDKVINIAIAAGVIAFVVVWTLMFRSFDGISVN